MLLSHIPFGGMMKQGSGNLSCLSLNTVAGRQPLCVRDADVPFCYRLLRARSPSRYDR